MEINSSSSNDHNSGLMNEENNIQPRHSLRNQMECAGIYQKNRLEDQSAY